MRRAIRISALAVIALATALAAAISWLAYSPSAAQWLVQELVAHFDGRLKVDAVDGSLAHGITIRGATYRQEGLHIEIDQAQVAWRWSALLAFHAHFRRLALGRVRVTMDSDGARPQLPASLAIPLRVSVSEGRIDQLTVATGARQTTLEDIEFRGSGGEAKHVLHAVSLRVAQGRVTGRGDIEASAPFALKADLTYSPAADEQLPRAQLALSGNLRELRADFSATAQWLIASGSATVSPFEQILVKHLAANVERFLPQQRFGDSLQADLHGTLLLRQVAEDRFEGELRWHNDDPGEIGERKVPIEMLAAQLRGNVDLVEFPALELRMPRGQALNGKGKFSAGALELTLDTRALDLKAWDKRLVSTNLSGSLELYADPQRQSLVALLTERDYRIETDAVRRGDLLTIKRASAAARGGSLTLSGDISLEPPYAFSAQGRLQRFDPSAFFETPRARINANISAKGGLTPEWSAQLAIRADGVGPRGEAFFADARGVVGPQRVADLQAKLTVGRNELTVEGAYGSRTDALAFNAHLRALQDLDSRFAGAIDAKGRVSGDRERHELHVEASGRQLVAPGRLRIGALQLRAALPSDWSTPLDFEAVASDVQFDATNVGKVVTTLHGTPRSHVIEASTDGKEIAARVRLEGGLTSIRGWTGTLAQLQVQYPTKVSLLAPARLSLAPEGVEIGSFALAAVDARLEFGQLVWTPDSFRSNGEFTHLNIAPFVSAWSNRMRSTLVLTGDWTIEERAGVLRGDLNVNREAGDLVLTGDAELPLALTALRIQARVESNRIRATARATSASLGEFSAAVTTEAVRSGRRWVLPPTAPLAIEAQGDFSSIAWLGPLIHPGVVLSGTLSLHASGQGTVGTPKLDGAIEGKALSIRVPATGVALTGGEVSATLVNDRVLVRSLRYKAGDGFVTVQGEATLRKGGSAQLRIEANKLMLLNRRDAQLELDASGSIVLAEGTIRLKGDSRVTRGHLDLLRKAGMPTLSSDIQVKGGKPAPPPREALRVIVDLNTDFGDRFSVTARGLGVGADSALKPISGDFKARIAGRIRIRSNEKQIPQTTGQLNVVDGSYTALGRTLRVQRGNLNFFGPLNNPALDIFVAPAPTRLQFTPEVGISITGTVQAPRVRLVSEPDMSETEKLSWLLFGHGGQKFDYAVGSTAEQVASPLTEFGWQLSDKLYAAYEQGATGTSNIVRFYSQVTDRIAIQAGTGDASSLFLLYTFTFD